MDIQTFAAAIQDMRLFPEALREGAIAASDAMNDAERAALYTELRGLYAQYEEIEEKRRRLLLEAIAQINAWRKVELPKLHQAIEQEEREAVMSAIDAQMSA